MRGRGHTSVCTRVSLDGIFSPSFQLAAGGGDCSLLCVSMRKLRDKLVTDLSDVAASWLVIWSAIGGEAAGWGIVRRSVDVVKVVSSYMRSTMQRQRGSIVPVQQATWGALAKTGSCLSGEEEAGMPEARERMVRVCEGWRRPRVAASLCAEPRGGAVVGGANGGRHAVESRPTWARLAGVREELEVVDGGLELRGSVVRFQEAAKPGVESVGGSCVVGGRECVRVCCIR